MNVCVYAFHIYINILQVTFHLLLKISETENKPPIESDRFPHIKQRCVAEIGPDRKRFPGITAACASVFTLPRRLT